MISISDAQLSIIRALIDRGKSKQKFPGMTSGMLGNNRINRRTFDINREYLLDNYLIKTTYEEKHGFQIWKYYDATLLGVLVYLSKIPALKINESIMERFFPLIAKHWNEIDTLYEKYTNTIFQKSIEKINVEERIAFGKATGGKVDLYRFPEETITLHFKDLQISLIKQIGIDPFQKPPDNHSIIRSYEVLEKSLAETTTFAFFYYLLSLVWDVEERTGIWSDFHLSVGKDGFVVKTKEQDHLTDINKFKRKIEKAAVGVLETIKKDEKISNLLRRHLDEIKNKLSTLEIISLFDKNLK